MVTYLHVPDVARTTLIVDQHDQWYLKSRFASIKTDRSIPCLFPFSTNDWFVLCLLYQWQKVAKDNQNWRGWLRNLKCLILFLIWYLQIHGQIPPHGVASQLRSGDVLHRVATWVLRNGGTLQPLPRSYCVGTRQRGAMLQRSHAVTL